MHVSEGAETHTFEVKIIIHARHWPFLHTKRPASQHVLSACALHNDRVPKGVCKGGLCHLRLPRGRACIDARTGRRSGGTLGTGQSC